MFYCAVAVFAISLVGLNKAIDPPTNVKVTNKTFDSLVVSFKKSPETASCTIKTTPKFWSRNKRLINASTEQVLVTGLHSNVVYEIAVRCTVSNESTSNYSEPVLARTHPNGSKVVVTNPLPTIFTAFLDPIPGATEWIVEKTNHRTNVTTAETCSSPYKIFRDATPDTAYTLRSRIARVKSNFLSEDESPFGEIITISTAKYSLFGRVILLRESFRGQLRNPLSEEFLTTAKKWERIILHEYASKRPDVFDVKTLEFQTSSSPPGTMMHHEILVSGVTVPDNSSLHLKNETFFQNLVIREDVSPRYQYGIIAQEGILAQYFHTDDVDCFGSEAFDQRNLSFHRHDGWILNFQLPALPEEGDITAEHYFTFHGLDLEGSDTYLRLQPNSLYSIDQRYLFKMCQPADTSSYLYSRRYGADHAFTSKAYNDTFTYSTGPEKIDPQVIEYDVTDDLKQMMVKMSAVYRAQAYNFSIKGVGRVEITDLDSSTFVEAAFNGIDKNTEYCIDVSVTINNPDWTQQTSDPSCFSFYSGSPNMTIARVVEVRPISFKVTFEKVKFSTSYIIEISNETYARNYTTTNNQYLISVDIWPRATYLVRVATRNPFGIGQFSLTKTTKFWNISDVTNGTIRLSWDSENPDVNYKVVVEQTGKALRTADNEATIVELDPGNHYNFNVSEITARGSSTLLFEDEQITVPGIPTYFQVGSKTAHELDVHWQAVVGADYYTVNISGRAVERTLARDSSTARFENLLSGSSYTLTVTSHNAAGFSEPAQRDFVTDFATPTNVTLMSVSSESITVKWNNISGANLFLVTVVPVSNDTVARNTSTSMLRATLTGLESGVNYSLTVVAVYDEGRSNQSRPLFQITVPGSPSNLRLLSNSEHAFSIAWDPADGVDFYALNLKGMNVSQNTSFTSIEFQNLRPNTGYTVQITAHSAFGSSLATMKKFFTEFLRPTNVTISAVKSDAFMLRWAGNGDAIKYLIIVSSPVEDKQVTSNTTTSETTGLRSYTNYSVAVTAVYLEGQSEQTERLHVLTALAPPENLRAIANLTTSIKLGWSVVNGAELYVVDVDGKDPYNTTNNETMVSNLSSGKAYEIRVKAQNREGSSNYAQGYFETVPSVPVITNSNSNETTLVLSWNAVVGATGYLVSVTSVDGSDVTGLSGIGVTLDASVTIGGLDANVGYAVQVSAKSGAGKSLATSPLIIQPAPAPPRDVRLLSRTSSSLKIVWSEVENASLYEINVGNYSTYLSTNMGQIRELSAGTSYYIYITSITKGGRKSSATSVEFQTLPNSPSINVSEVTQTSMKISLQARKGADSYIVGFAVNSTFTIDKNASAQTVFSFSSLTAGTQYTINATSVVKNEHSYPPTTLLAHTLCEPPSGIAITSVTDSSVSLMWNPSQGANGYDVNIVSSERRRRLLEAEPEVRVNETNAKVENLSPGMNYLLKVVAVNQAGKSESESVALTTGASNPNSLRIINVTTSSATIEWNEQRGATRYRVTVAGQLNNEFEDIGVTLVKLDSLEPGHSYSISVRATSLTEPGAKVFQNNENVPTVTVITVPLAPSGLSVTRVGNELFASWKITNGTALYLIRVETESANFIRNTTSANFTMPLTDDKEYVFTVVAVNAQMRSSARSPPITFRVTNTTSEERGQIPWWVFLIVSSFIFVLIVAVAAFWFSRRKRGSEDQIGFYSFEYRNRELNDDEVATDRMQMQNLEEGAGHIGPQDPEESDEENSSNAGEADEGNFQRPSFRK